MDVVATKARDAARVHDALGKVIALHTVLVTSPVGKVGEGLFAGFEFFKVPEVFEVQSLVKAHGPGVVLPGN